MDLPSTFVDGFHNEYAVRDMKYTTLGVDGPKLSKLGIGGASLGGHYGDVTDEVGISLVREAFKQGVNYIDTSPYYGHTDSEKLIGKALAGVPREAFYISSKVGRYGLSWEDYFNFSAEHILKEFDRSLQRLGLEYVDILFVHDIEFTSMQKILTESLPAIQTLKDKKKVRYLGVSGYPLSVLWEAAEKSKIDIDVVLSYARSCLFDSSMKTYASFFQTENVGLINASLTGMGLLTYQGPPDWHPASEQLKTTCRSAADFCKNEGVELGRLAIYQAMQAPWFSSHLVGMKTLEELKSNLEIATKGLSDLELKVLDDVKSKFFNSSENQHWEGVELELYNNFFKAKNISPQA